MVIRLSRLIVYSALLFGVFRYSEVAMGLGLVFISDRL